MNTEPQVLPPIEGEDFTLDLKKQRMLNFEPATEEQSVALGELQAVTMSDAPRDLIAAQVIIDNITQTSFVRKDVVEVLLYRYAKHIEQQVKERYSIAENEVSGPE